MSANLGYKVQGQPFESNTPDSAPSRPKRVSLLRYSPALVFIAIAIADSQRWADPDLWGHLRFGQAVIAQRHLVTHDPYSYSVPGYLWIDHEWLSEILMAGTYNLLGTIGLKLMKLACSGAVVLFLTLGMAETGAPTLTQFTVLIAASVSLAPQTQFRPQIFTFALLSGLLAMLARYSYRGRGRIWIAIPLLTLWANLHGGYIMGLTTLGIFSSVTLAQDVLEGRGFRRGLGLLAITAASTLATLVTPYGFGTWQVVIHALHNPHTRIVIDDWQSLLKALRGQWSQGPLGTYYIVIGVAMFATLAATFVRTPRGGDAALVCVAAVMIVSAFIAIRNLPIAVIATVIPLARHLAIEMSARRKRLGLQEPAERPPADAANTFIVIAVTLALLVGTGLFSREMAAGDPYPVGAIRFMKEHHLHGNIMANFGWGEYVIWHTYPESRIFIDGRYDTAFPADTIDEYLGFHYALGGAKAFLHKFPHDYVLMTRKAPAYKFMQAQSDWKEIYRDGTGSLFVRADSPAAAIAPLTVSKKDTPKSYFP